MRFDFAYKSKLYFEMIIIKRTFKIAKIIADETKYTQLKNTAFKQRIEGSL